MEGGSNLPNNLIGFIYSIATSTPIVWWSLGSIPGRKYSTLGQVFRQVVACLERHCDALVGYSSRAVRYFRSIGISEQKCFRAVNVVDVDSIMAEINDVMAYRHESRADLGFKSDEPVLIFVGSLNPAKKAHLLPIILRRVRSVHRNTTMTVIGDGPSLAAVKLAAEEQGMTPFIRFTGAMSEGVGQHFAAADVMILPGLGGLAIGQSLAYGTPVICSVADGTEEDLIDNPCSGIVLESCEDENFLADKLAQAVVNQLRHCIASPQARSTARSLIETRYTLKQYSLSVRAALSYAYQNK
jgi:glycosyltransferase involved in cell wall biosynthesis